MPTLIAVGVFASVALAYFFSALVRGVTATLAPEFGAELALTAGDLGLLAGAYFFGFACTQLPLGAALDRVGPRRVLLTLLALAVAGCAAFALARDFRTLLVARALIGVGVSACLMAPMTLFRRHFSPVAQLRANAWMLMAGSLGMVASTLPVRWLLPWFGWRGLFWGVAAALALSIAAIAWRVPRSVDASPASPAALRAAPVGRYLDVFGHPTFVRFAPLGVFGYGGLIAVQSLWAGPWLVQVCGWSADEAGQGLFAVNIAMLLSFLAWGALLPRLAARGWGAQQLVGRAMPVSLAALALAVLLGPRATAWVWVLYCAGSTSLALSLPAVGLAFGPALAGRAMSAYNLLVFIGVFVVQWGIGLVIDVLGGFGWNALSSYRAAFALLNGCCAAAYVWFLCRPDGAPRHKPVFSA